MAKVLALLIISVFIISGVLGRQELQGEMYGRDHHYRHGGGHGPGSMRSFECPGACGRRCGQTQYKKACLTFCNKCCRKCLCVPPGFYGNKQVCPCYNNWKTKRGGPKCP